MSLADRLGATPGQDFAGRGRIKHPAGWEPGAEVLGDTGRVITEPLDAPPNDWSELLAVWDLDPAQWTVLEPVQYRAWDANLGEGNVKRLFYYRANIVKRTDLLDVRDLFARYRRRGAPAKASGLPLGRPFLFAVGDLQLGEWSADGGSERVVPRFYDVLEQAVTEYRKLRKMGHAGGKVILPWLGDCVQGTVSQGGGLVMRLDLTPSEALQGVETMMTDAVEAFSKIADTVELVSVPGNHDETHRIGDKMATRHDDSWAVKAAWAVRLTARKAGWDNVVVRTPEVDRLTVTAEYDGTVVGMAHGHQWGGEAHKGHDWLAGQAFGRQAIGDSDVLLSGHRHHYYGETRGARTVICVPALAGDSAWFRERRGESVSSGALVLTLSDTRVHDLVVLHA